VHIIIISGDSESLDHFHSAGDPTKRHKRRETEKEDRHTDQTERESERQRERLEKISAQLLFFSHGHTPGCVCLLLQYLIQSCARGGRRIVEDMCYEIRRAEACVTSFIFIIINYKH
jgi:hypothetical protein